MKDPQKNLSDLNSARKAHLILEMMDPVVKDMENGIVAELRSLYRGGSTDGIKYIAASAQLCLIEDLSSRLRADINKGNRAAKEIRNDNARRE